MIIKVSEALNPFLIRSGPMCLIGNILLDDFLSPDLFSFKESTANEKEVK